MLQIELYLCIVQWGQQLAFMNKASAVTIDLFYILCLLGSLRKSIGGNTDSNYLYTTCCQVEVNFPLV